MEIYILSASVKDYTDPVTRSDKGQKGHGLMHKTSVCTVINISVHILFVLKCLPFRIIKVC